MKYKNIISKTAQALKEILKKYLKWRKHKIKYLDIISKTAQALNEILKYNIQNEASLK